MTLPPPVPLPRRTPVVPHSTIWVHLRQELLYLSFALMEIALVTPVALVIMGWARYWPPGLVSVWLLLVMFLPLNLNRLMSLLHFETNRQRWIMFFALLLMAILSWRMMLYPSNGLLDFGWLRQFTGSLAEGGNLLWTRDLSLFLLTTVMWWRGIRLAGRTPEINNTGLRLRLGSLIILPLIIWFSSLYLDFSIVPYVLLFFMAGLITVALVRAEQIEQEQTGTSSTLNARWLGVVAAAAGLIVLLSGIIAAFISGESLFVVLEWLSPLWRALQFGALVAGTVILTLASPILNVFAWLVQVLGILMAGLLGLISGGLRDAGILENLAPPITITPTETVEVSGVGIGDRLFVTVAMLALIALVSLALAQAYRRATVASREGTLSQPAREDVEADKPGFGRRLLERLGLARQWRAAASVKRIYQQMCAVAAANGFPRLEVETPYEYLPTLSQVWPEHASESRLITEAFVLVRYGEVPETKEELDRIKQAWARLEATEPVRQTAANDDMPTLAKRE